MSALSCSVRYLSIGATSPSRTSSGRMSEGRRNISTDCPPCTAWVSLVTGVASDLDSDIGVVFNKRGDRCIHKLAGAVATVWLVAQHPVLERAFEAASAGLRG